MDIPELKLPPQVAEITKPTACLIRFNLDRPDVLYEVVVDPQQKSPSGFSIRFEHGKGCEVHGWKPIDSFHVVEVLKEFEREEFDWMTDSPKEREARVLAEVERVKSGLVL